MKSNTKLDIIKEVIVIFKITEIVDLQSKLDQSIYEKFNLNYENTFTKRKLALIVELSELANEVRSFKFWSLKSASSKNIILEEYVDCIHFCISLGIGMNIDFENIEVTPIDSDDINETFIATIESVTKLNKDEVITYKFMFDNILNLAKQLDFSYDDIFKSYLNKNQINHKRQENNY